MDDAESMCFGEAFAGLENDVDRIFEGERSGVTKALRERLAAQVFHDEVGLSVFERTHVHQARDVLAPQTDRDARLASKARDGVASGPGRQELQRDALAELEVQRGDDDAHSAAADDALDAVLVRDHRADAGFGGRRTARGATPSRRCAVQAWPPRCQSTRRGAPPSLSVNRRASHASSRGPSRLQCPARSGRDE